MWTLGSAGQLNPADVATSAKINQHGQIRINGGFMTGRLTLTWNQDRCKRNGPRGHPLSLLFTADSAACYNYSQ